MSNKNIVKFVEQYEEIINNDNDFDEGYWCQGREYGDEIRKYITRKKECGDVRESSDGSLHFVRDAKIIPRDISW